MKYLEFNFTVSPFIPGSEILIAELGEIGFESFVETEDGLQAYILAEEYKDELFSEIQIFSSSEFEISFTSKEIEQVNWNSEWEKNFSPIQVEQKCSVRAPFHPKPETEYDIVIEPKMSFGTGHHATTHMMLQLILKNEWQGKKVLDMGCGTGVLAILAQMKGAKHIDAIDIDNWCYLNTLENVERNNCSKIDVFEGDASLLEGRKYDRIIANINRNILLNDIKTYAECLLPSGEIFLSGFYTDDVSFIEESCNQNGLFLKDSLERENWVALNFAKEKKL
ncbi:MAG: 50S ribosomal protein L11 methyltransferase [Gillisia sp.]